VAQLFECGPPESLTIAVTVTVTIPGQKKTIEHRHVRVFVQKAKKKHGA
jgi:hypothetical protein